MKASTFSSPSDWNSVATLILLLMMGAWACSGGGGSSPTEPVAPAPTQPDPVPTPTPEPDPQPDPDPDAQTLQISWKFDMGMGPITGQDSLVAGETLTLFNEPGGNDNHPDIAECRSTGAGEIQAYYHDSLSGTGPGTLGLLVASGCSRAEEYSLFTKCCLVEP